PTNGYARLGLAAALALSAELVHWFNGNAWIAALLALLAIALGGLRTYQLGWQALKNKTLNVNSLMTVAVTGAFIIGQWAEAAMVMVLFTLADMIEARTVDKARHSIAQLDRKSTRLNSSHVSTSYAVFCLKRKKNFFY